MPRGCLFHECWLENEVYKPQLPLSPLSGFFCSLTGGLKGPVLGRCCAPAADPYGLVECFQPLPPHSFTRSWYLAAFSSLASSSQGIVSSGVIPVFWSLGAGDRVWTEWGCGNVSHFPTSSCSCQSEAVGRRRVVDRARAWASLQLWQCRLLSWVADVCWC